jgi:hypothetical protein
VRALNVQALAKRLFAQSSRVLKHAGLIFFGEMNTPWGACVLGVQVKAARRDLECGSLLPLCGMAQLAACGVAEF